MLLESDKKKVKHDRRKSISASLKSKLSSKESSEAFLQLNPLPKRSLLRPWTLQRATSDADIKSSAASETGSIHSLRSMRSFASAVEFSRGDILKSSKTKKAISAPLMEPSLSASSAASSVVEFTKLKRQCASMITTSSDGGHSPKQRSQRRKPVRRPAASQITNELKDKDGELQSRFRETLFVRSKSAPSKLAATMSQLPDLPKSSSPDSEEEYYNFGEKDIDLPSEDRKHSALGSLIDELEKSQDSSPTFGMSDHLTPRVKAKELEEDLDTVVRAEDFNDLDADIIFHSSKRNSETDRQAVNRFRIHAVNLAVHSPAMMQLYESVCSSESDFEITLQEDADTLKLLFGLMYNRQAAQLGPGDWQKVVNLAECAEKYDVARAKETAVAYFIEQERRGAVSPFVTYSFAVQYNLPDLEAASAERSALFDINSLPETTFKMMGFQGFQKLAAYHSSRQTYYWDVLNSIVIDPRDLAEQCYQTNGTCVILPWNNLKQKLAWSKADRKQTTDRRLMPDHVMTLLISEIGEIDCGTCCRALVQAALEAKKALEMPPMYEV